MRKHLCLNEALPYCADYSQIELRLMAHLSQDEGMYRLSKMVKIYTPPQQLKFSGRIRKVSREHRSYAKMVNFGIIYGISAFGLAQRLIRRGEAKEIIDNYFMQYPKVKDIWT